MAHLWLVGMMGSGKSTVGAILAARHGRPFYDLDRLVETAAGRTVTEIFAAEGEEGFRIRERRAVVAVSKEPAGVVAAGGGAVLDPENVRHMRDHGLVVLLDASLEVLARRSGRGRGRPLLGEDPRVTLAELARRRRDAYRRAAHRVVAADGPAEEVADAVEAVWIDT